VRFTLLLTVILMIGADVHHGGFDAINGERTAHASKLLAADTAT
jgi:hypothetical protein